MVRKKSTNNNEEKRGGRPCSVSTKKDVERKGKGKFEIPSIFG